MPHSTLYIGHFGWRTLLPVTITSKSWVQHCCFYAVLCLCSWIDVDWVMHCTILRLC